jgi:enoyl-CoA hydratase/carnithine racemase
MSEQPIPYQTIRYEVADHVATVTLQRPEKLNAANPRMVDDLITALDRIDADDDIRAVIVTGSGRAFCAGADISGGTDGFAHSRDRQRTQSSGDPPRIHRDGGGLLTLRIYQCLKPLIAAINGPAVGMGVTMTLPMDIRLASSEARFGLVFARRGIVPEAASSFFLPHIVGISRALQWCLSGRMVSSEEALAAGLVSALHAPHDLLPAAREAAREIADNTSAVSVALTRQMLWRGLTLQHPMEAHRLDSRMLAGVVNSPDAVEGVQSFLQKRPANFPGRVSTNMPNGFPWWTEPGFE